MTKTHLALVVLAVLQAGFLLADEFLVDHGYDSRVTVPGDRLFPGLAAEQIASLELKRGAAVTELRRQGEGFVVASEGGKRADENLVRSALSALAGLRPGSVVSENPAKHQDFDVAGERALLVTARDAGGQVVARLTLGKSTADWSGVYARQPPESDDVMLLRSNIRSLFDRDGGKAGAWRDKTLFNADPRTVREVEITKPAETIVVKRQLAASLEPGREGELVASDDDDWLVVAPVEGLMSRYQGNSLATTAASLRAEGFADGARSLAELGLDPPLARVTVRRAGGDPLVFDVGNEEEGKRFVRAAGVGDGDVALVASFRLAVYLKEGKELPEQRAPVEPGDAGEAGEAGAADEPLEAPKEGGGQESAPPASAPADPAGGDGGTGHADDAEGGGARV